jgi:hypothetical protein
VIDWAVIERIVASGDLSGLSPQHRTAYYLHMCQIMGLNAATRPLEYLALGRGNQKTIVLYIRSLATDQIAERKDIRRAITAIQRIGDLLVVTVRASMPDGRYTDSIGAVAVLEPESIWTSENGRKIKVPTGKRTTAQKKVCQ